ncbi:MAG: hypothetical protein R3B96_06245 [Pirellulaceae bacterium]
MGKPTSPPPVDGDDARVTDPRAVHAGHDRTRGNPQTGQGKRRRVPEQTAIANPYDDSLPRSRRQCLRLLGQDAPKEAKEIKPHPYGVELGRLFTMLKDSRRRR